MTRDVQCTGTAPSPERTMRGGSVALALGPIPHGAIGVALGVALRDGVALVVRALAARDGELDLGPAVFEVEAERDERHALLGDRTVDLVDLALVEEELARSYRVELLLREYEYGATCIPCSTTSWSCTRVGLTQVGLALADRLHLCALEHEAALIGVDDEVVVASATVVDRRGRARRHPVTVPSGLTGTGGVVDGRRGQGTQLGVGLIGCGMIGQVHAAGLGQLVEDGDVRAVAAADLSEDARNAANRNARGFDRLHQDAQAVIDDPDVEAVLIASPTSTHRDLLLATLAAGKPVLCEKPLAPTFAVVREMHDAVAASGVAAQVGFHSRFHYLFNRLRDLVQSGELGAPMGYVLREDQYWPTGDVVPGHSSWRSDRRRPEAARCSSTRSTVPTSCHGCSVPRSVCTAPRSQFGYDVEDIAAANVEHASGVIGTFLTVFNGMRGREERRLEVFFERGVVELTADFVVGAPEDGLLIQRPDEPAEHPDLDALRAAHWKQLGVTRPDVFFYLYLGARAWVQSVRAGTTPSPGFGDALAAHALVEAAYRSAASGDAITLDGDLALP